MKISLNKILLFLVFLLAFVFGLKMLKEPDLWWQLRTGEWIVHNLRVPTQDFFSFTFSGHSWFNVKWIAEIFLFGWSKIFGLEGITFFQSVINVLIVFIFSKIWNKIDHKNNILIFIVTSLLYFLIANDRMNSRPEIFSHLFTILFIYLIYFSTKKYKWSIIIFLQIIWQNTHEAFFIGIILMAIFIAGKGLEYFQKKSNFPKNELLILVIMFILMMLNPRGYLIYKVPLEIFSQVQQNKFTIELASIGNTMYWTFEAYLFVFELILLSIYFIKNTKSIVSKLSVSYFISVLAFLFLATTAHRNIIFAQHVLTPFLILYLQTLFSSFSKKYTSWFLKSSLVFMIILYILLVSNSFYSLTGKRENFGIEIESFSNPKQASDFIKNKGLQNQKCFSDYLSSSYFLYNNQPNFKTFIDLRDLDVFTDSFFNEYAYITEIPDSFIKLDRKLYNFEFVILQNQIHTNLHRYLYNDSIYACVYVDPVVAIYQKTDTFPQGNIFVNSEPIKRNLFSKIVQSILNPFRTCYPYQKINYNILCADYYAKVWQIEIAQKALIESQSEFPEDKNNELVADKINQLIQLRQNRFKP